MSTTIVETWATDISALGPIYPFVGGEVLFWLLGLIFWISGSIFCKDAARGRGRGTCRGCGIRVTSGYASESARFRLKKLRLPAPPRWAIASVPPRRSRPAGHDVSPGRVQSRPGAAARRQEGSRPQPTSLNRHKQEAARRPSGMSRRMVRATDCPTTPLLPRATPEDACACFPRTRRCAAARVSGETGNSSHGPQAATLQQ